MGITSRSDGYHVTYGGESMNSFNIDGSIERPDLEAAMYALAPGKPRMSVELWEDGVQVQSWHPDDIDVDESGQPTGLGSRICPAELFQEARRGKSTAILCSTCSRGGSSKASRRGWGSGRTRRAFLRRMRR